MSKDKSLLDVTVIPAQPGYVTLYDLDDCYDVLEVVIGWRVETRAFGDHGEHHTSTYPVTIDGDPSSNCVGVQQPDGRVILFGTGEMYGSLAEINAALKPQSDGSL
jgi:hypothetical protein